MKAGGPVGGYGLGTFASTSPTMTHMGSGKGSYTTEVKYKFVGGGGEFDYVRPKAKFDFCGLSVGAALLATVLVIVLSIILWPSATTTTPLVVGGPMRCIIWGDLHVDTFDHDVVSQYGQGDWWVVKSSAIHIQARVLATPATKGLPAAHDVVIGGPFMSGHTVSVGPADGQILVDSFPACEGWPSHCDIPGVVSVRYDGEGQFIDAASSHQLTRTVHIAAPFGVHVQVLRWPHHVNVEVRMPLFVGIPQDGMCGNFNGIAHDDKASQIEARGAGRVAAGHRMFRNSTASRPASRARCSGRARAAARKLCVEQRPELTRGARLEACVADVCRVGARYAAQDSVSESEV